jgi:hypothetical protein
LLSTDAEKHVSVDAHELKMSIKNRLELEDRVVFDDLCKLMEGVANFDFFDLKDRWVKHNTKRSSSSGEHSATGRLCTTYCALSGPAILQLAAAWLARPGQAAAGKFPAAC